MPVIISIDPGVSGTGVAIWDAETWDICVPPLEIANLYGHVKKKNLSDLDAEDHFTYQAYDIADQLEPFLSRECLQVYCEYPALFAGSAMSRACAVKGDLQKLTFIIGVFAGYCRRRAVPIPFKPVRVNDWKGQLPKDVVNRRIVKVIPNVLDLNPTTHSYDAIGIGLYAKGCMP